MRFKLTAALLFANIAMFLFIWYLEYTPALQSQSAGGMADFTVLEISGKTIDKPRILKFENNRWRIVSPIDWPANFYALNRIRNQLEFLEKETCFDISEIEKHGQSIADYGLDDPIFTFKYGDGKNMRELKIGKNTPVGDKVYMQDVSNNRIVVAEKTLAENLSNDIDMLRGQNIFEIPRFEISSVSVRLPAGDSKTPLRSDLRRIGLVKDGQDWNFETPIVAHADAGEVNAFLDMLENVSVRSFAPQNAVNTGLDVTSLPASVTIQGTNRKQTLLLGSTLQNGTLRYARLEETPTVFMVDAAFFKNLGEIQTALRDKAFLKFDELALDEIDIASPSSSVKLKKIKPGEWDAIGKGAGGNLETVPADFAAVNSIISKLKAIRAAEFVTDAPGDDAKRFGFDAPSLKISLKLASGAAQTLVVGGEFSAQNARLLYAAISGENAVYGISPNLARGIPSDILSCKTKVLGALPEKAEIRGFCLSEIGGRNLLELSCPDNDWKKALASVQDFKRASASAILAGVKKFSVLKYVDSAFSEKGVDVGGKHFDWKYKLSAEIVMPGTGGNKTQTRAWLLSGREGGRVQYGASPEGGEVFQIPQPLIDAISAFTIESAPPEALNIPAPAPLGENGKK
ncbi:MAG: DUF4340 domain-containing protein [Opitutales bacterium]|nr:DUF4340 domain-containing protein [Opitutales bacterium]